jgi:hypothetical protein
MTQMLQSAALAFPIHNIQDKKNCPCLSDGNIFYRLKKVRNRQKKINLFALKFHKKSVLPGP